MKKLLLAAALLVAMSGCTLSEQTETEVICPPQADNGIDIEPWHPSGLYGYRQIEAYENKGTLRPVSDL